MMTCPPDGATNHTLISPDCECVMAAMGDGGSGGGGQEIDLYADNFEEEFNQESEYDHNPPDPDLYDDVIAPSTGIKTENGSGAEDHAAHDSDLAAGDAGSSSRRISIYVGNLTWWTSDTDIIEAIHSIGITDVSDVKFFENRANGQSKGFCVVNLGSDASVRQVIEKLPKLEIQGQNPAVTPCNRQALNHFELQSRKMNPAGQGAAAGPQQMGMAPGPRPPYNPNMSGPPAGMRPPLIGRQPRPNGPLLGQPRLPMQQPYGQQQWRPAGMHSGAHRMRMPLMSPHSSRGPGQPLLRAPGPPPDSGRHHSEWQDHGNHQQSGGGYGNPPMPMRGPGGPPAGSGMGMHHHAAHSQGPTNVHLNPAFIQAQGQNPSPNDYNRSGYMGQDSYRHSAGGDMSGMTDAEMDEILEKNRSVSRSAISRAVADASSGDYTAAVDTLVTAIGLIKQSKVSHEERCKVIVASLQDTLHSIETQAFTSRNRGDRDRHSRDRHRSSRSPRREKRRERSRSREYRSRERDSRYHDDRYHDDHRRDRERDHRRH